MLLKQLQDVIKKYNITVDKIEVKQAIQYCSSYPYLVQLQAKKQFARMLFVLNYKNLLQDNVFDFSCETFMKEFPQNI